MTHEMQNLLFAALETFSLILSRTRGEKQQQQQKKAPKNGGIPFSDYLPWESAGAAARRVIVCSISDQFYTNSDEMEHLFFLKLAFKGFQQSPPLRHACLPAYPGLKYRDVLQAVVLN